MEIVHVVENLDRGGLERTVVDLIASQRDAGHECRVICLFKLGLLARELLASGVRVDACGKRPGLDLRALRRARALIRQSPDAVIHTHNAMAHYYAVLASLGLPVKCRINTRHGMGGRTRSGRQEWLYRQSLRGTDYAVAVCEAARQRFAADGMRPRRALLSVPNGIRLERFRPADDVARQSLVAELGLPTGSRIIGTVGRLQPVKDHALLLRAFAKVRVQVPEAALVIVGDGPLRAALEAQAEQAGLSDAVRFMGDRHDVPRLLTGMEVFALTSTSEGYSVALLEACASSLPIVATDVGGNREIVRHGINGRLVPSGDTAAIATALIALLRGGEQAAAMGRAGYAWAQAEASFRTMAERYHGLYDVSSDLSSAAMALQGRVS
ncbi:glycosyltransferase [Pseudoxanthomonas mexicana]|uniref:Glycosyltransferase n=1 Tax=Pseudoxanthomonas mexicana TaxID=128785 RepID=A0A7G9TBH3_PSEMX|nr:MULTISPECIES: glycosyltransferase [Pseudoxanthomonas]KAF1721870.1 glycosyltransferase [Pseudoxanthomonas mexicana]MCH2090469.1 glycosyltransferase [Pseudoxanthomonas sp.]QNN77448.1 glycosyltransferase [Pseudoxanthomonas mexicana]